MKNTGIFLLIVLLLIGGWIFLSKDSSCLGSGGFGGQDTYVMSTEYGTTSISTCISSEFRRTPTSTDPSAPTSGTHNSWDCATTTYNGIPDEIPNSMNNAGFEYCIDGSNTGQAVRFWLKNATGTDKAMSVGSTSSGFLVTAGNCWKSKDYGIIWGGGVHALASTTTSTLRYQIFKGQ